MNSLSPKKSSSEDDCQSPSGDDALRTPTPSNFSLVDPAKLPLPSSTAYIEQQSTTNTPLPAPNHPLPPNSHHSSPQTSTESSKPPPSLAALIAERWSQANPDEKRRYLEKEEESKGA